MALVGNVPVKIGTVFGDNAPMIRARGKRHTDRIVSRRREVFYLLMTLVRNIPIKENCHAIAILRGYREAKARFVTLFCVFSRNGHRGVTDNSTTNYDGAT